MLRPVGAPPGPGWGRGLEKRRVDYGGGEEDLGGLISWGLDQETVPRELALTLGLRCLENCY